MAGPRLTDDELLDALKRSGAFPQPDHARMERGLAEILAAERAAQAPVRAAAPRSKWRWIAYLTPPALAAAAALYLFVLRSGPVRLERLESAAAVPTPVTESPLATRADLARAMDESLGALLRTRSPGAVAAAARDLPPIDPAQAWIAAGILPIDDGVYGPTARVTRGELVMALHAAFEKLGGRAGSATAHYADVPPDHFAFQAVAVLAPEVVSPRSQDEFGVSDGVTVAIVREAASRLAARLGAAPTP